MKGVERGKLIVAAAKSLKRYQLGDHRIAAFLYATWFAGRAALFTSSIRTEGHIPRVRVVMLGACEGFSPIELHSQVLPWLENQGLCSVERQNAEFLGIESTALGYESILRATSRLYESLHPADEDRACLEVLACASSIPMPESELLQQVATSFGEEKAETAISLAKAYKIVAFKSGKGLREPILYCQTIWSRQVGRAGSALVGLARTQRAVVLELVEKVRKYQGMPDGLLRREAAQHGAEDLLDLAIGVGLLNRTDLQMAGGDHRSFLTTPHFYQDLAAEHGEDVCDRVKIFLDSIRNGQHFGGISTGKILDPEVLLRRLLDSGKIGPCTAIGTDYVTSEKAGIVVIRRGSRKQDSIMELAQKDTVQKVLEVITTGRIEDARASMEASHMRDGTRFRSIEENRAEAGDVPDSVAEAERAIILKLREA